MALQECRLNLGLEIKKNSGRMERWNFHVRGILHTIQGGRRTAFRGTGMKRLRWYMLQKAGWN